MDIEQNLCKITINANFDYTNNSRISILGYVDLFLGLAALELISTYSQKIDKFKI